jgi:hypothetical protein
MRRGTRRATGLVVFAAACAMTIAGMDPASGTVASQAAHGSKLVVTPHEAPEPPTAPFNPHADLSAISCRSDKVCVATGNLRFAGHHPWGQLDTYAKGKWTSVRAPMPATTRPGLRNLRDVSCVAASACIAVGGYRGNGAFNGLIETRSGSTWKPRTAPVPTNADGDSLGSLFQVSCAVDGTCVAIGDYMPAGTISDSVLETRSGGSWTATAAPLPTGSELTMHSYVQLNGVACALGGSCVAIGEYGGSSPVPLVEILSLGSWTAMPIQLPTGAAATANVVLDDVTCSPNEVCVVTGTYLDDKGQTQGLLDVGSNGRWKSTTAPLPAGTKAKTADLNLGSVACSPTGQRCVAFGNYFVGKAARILVETRRHGRWTAEGLVNPTTAAPDESTRLAQVTCPGAGFCIAVGIAFDYADGGIHIVIYDSTSGGWHQVRHLRLPANAEPHSSHGLEAVGCWSDRHCAAVGQYNAPSKQTKKKRSRNSYQGLIETVR